MQLPAPFADLQDLADRYAIGDDVERDRATSAASAEERQRLVDRVSPRFPEINAYLDKHDDEPAHHLGSLAEAACEVYMEIEHPRK